VRGTTLARRHDFGNDALTVSYQNCLARLRQSDVFTQTVLQDLEADRTHLRQSSF
jgi:hypothetical protein